VLQVIDAVKRVHGRDFKAVHAPRRPGDAEAIVAGSDKVRAVLGWRPEFNDLDTIVAHALTWEKGLDGLKERS
jgi:UDP-glucose 4-epimerase